MELLFIATGTRSLSTSLSSVHSSMQLSPAALRMVASTSSCLKAGEGMTPAVQLSVNYHRPLIPGMEVLVKVHVVSVTRSLISLSAEASAGEYPDKLCLSGTGLYFCKPAGDPAKKF